VGGWYWKLHVELKVEILVLAVVVAMIMVLVDAMRRCLDGPVLFRGLSSQATPYGTPGSVPEVVC